MTEVLEQKIEPLHIPMRLMTEIQGQCLSAEVRLYFLLNESRASQADFQQAIWEAQSFDLRGFMRRKFSH